MSFETSLAWLIVSKALLRSKKQTPAMQLESTLHLLSSTSVIAASSVDLFLLNQTENPRLTCFLQDKLKIVYELLFPLLSTQQIEWKQDGNFQFR